jgi:hypothetical protein
MPMAISDLEDKIDEVADTKRWLKGDANTITSLKAEGFDFKSHAGGDLLASAVAIGDADLVRDLIKCCRTSSYDTGIAVSREAPADICCARIEVLAENSSTITSLSRSRLFTKRSIPQIKTCD